MKTKKMISTFDFRIEERVRTALDQLADSHGLTCSGYLRMLILREHALMESGKTN